MFSPANTSHITLTIPSVDTDLQVLEFIGREMLNKPYHFEIELVSERTDLDLDALINQTAYLAFGPSGKGVHRIIYGIEQGDSGKRLTRYRISLRPQLTYLGHSFNQRIFQQMTAPAIIAAVLEEYGLLASTGYHFQFGPYVYPERDYCTQYDESDLHFLQRLCEEEGLSFHFQHGEDNHLLVFGDDASVFPRLDPLNYQQDSGLSADHEVVRAFGVRLETRSSQVTWRDYDFEQPKLQMEAGYSSEFFPTLEVYDYPGRFTDRARGKHLAKRSLERLRTDFELAEGKSDAYLASGHFLALAGHPRQQWNATSGCSTKSSTKAGNRRCWKSRYLTSPLPPGEGPGVRVAQATPTSSRATATASPPRPGTFPTARRWNTANPRYSAARPPRSPALPARKSTATNTAA